MSAETTQTHIYGEPEEGSVSIETEGRVIRPIFDVVHKLVDEVRVHFTEDGLEMRAVDPANVAQTFVRVPPHAFDTYEVKDELTQGIDLDALSAALSMARKGKRTSDPVALDVDGRRILVTVTREYGETTLRQTNEVLTIDPDSLRSEPDLLDLEGMAWRAVVNADAWVDAIRAIEARGPKVKIEENDGHMILADRQEEGDSYADFGMVAEKYTDDAKEGMASLFSIDYLEDMAKGIDEALVDTVAVRWGSEFPGDWSFTRTDEDGEIVYECQYQLAPRVESS